VLPSKFGSTPLVAVGKINSKVSIHTLSGALLREFVVNKSVYNVIIDVEWIKGPGPRAVEDKASVEMIDETWIELYAVNGTLRSRKTRSSHDATSKDDIAFQPSDNSMSSYQTPNEEVTGTVCHRPSDNVSEQQTPQS
jgi:hypothetical protein